MAGPPGLLAGKPSGFDRASLGFLALLSPGPEWSTGRPEFDSDRTPLARLQRLERLPLGNSFPTSDSTSLPDSGGTSHKANLHPLDATSLFGFGDAQNMAEPELCRWEPEYPLLL